MATIRKNPLVNGEIYHIYSRSIAEFRIFNNRAEFFRMFNTMQFYQFENLPIRLARFLELQKTKKSGFRKKLLNLSNGKSKRIDFISYCLMPTHIHLVLKQLGNGGISRYMGNALNSYTRYFNLKHHRKGPLWEGRFKSVLIENDEQLVHLTRYIHLNPTTARLVDNPEEWEFSSYREYLGKVRIEDKICKYSHILDIKPKQYQKFVNNRIDYQRELAKIKQLLFGKG